MHNDTSALLAFWHPGDAAQARLRSEILRYISGVDCSLDRSCPTGHVTASTIVFDHQRHRVLLTLHPKIGRWLQMGGHVEPEDPSFVAAARREATEESGIADLILDPTPVDVDIHDLHCPKGQPNRHLDIRFAAVAPPGAVEVISDESLDLRWFALDSLPIDLDVSTLRLISRSLARASQG